MRRPTLITQVLAINALLVTAVLGAAVAAATLDPERPVERWQLGVLAAAMLATVLVDGLVLRRRFAPLESLITAVEAVERASGDLGPEPAGEVDEVVRLHRAFAAMLQRLEAERAGTAAAVLRAQERERARIARDLHDECNQALTGLLLRLEACAHDAPPTLAEDLRGCQVVASRAMEELLGLARELRPATLDELGLAAAVRGAVAQAAGRAGWATEVRLDPEAVAALDDDAQLAAYRVVQEALVNAARHAGAARVACAVTREGDVTWVRVVDDGRGFDRPRAGGLGLAGMRERAALAGGRLAVRSAPGAGTTVELAL